MDVKDYLFKGNMPLYGKALDAYALRQRTIAKNISNATTPGYRPERVRFEEEFSQNELAMRGLKSEDGHLRMGTATNAGEVDPAREDAPVPKPEVYFSGESHVNVDREMSELAQNQIRFRLASRLTQRYFSGLQSAIRGTAQ
ncbi:MAG: flagellar basal body rod protein FlgB [Candidatus Kapabacteria bacterium]|nr:flagellar basal body rod protein FlgB [Candidatus Kapabacteria bacterium]